MMGALREVGTGKMTMERFREMLGAKKDFNFTHMAKASGLILHKVDTKSP